MRSSNTEALSPVLPDLCRVVSGPFATMHLGDPGDVEDRGFASATSRRYGPPFVNGRVPISCRSTAYKRSCD